MAPPAPRVRVIRRIGVLSVAKIYGAMLAAIGLIFGLFFGLVVMALGGASEAAGAETAAFAGLGFFAIILFPLLYGAIGFVFGALSAALYNLLAGWLGGVEFEVA